MLIKGAGICVLCFELFVHYTVLIKIMHSIYIVGLLWCIGSILAESRHRNRWQ